MKRNLHADRLGKLRKSGGILLQERCLAQALAQHELSVDQIEARVGVVMQDRVSLKIPFRGHSLARSPSFALVGPENRHQIAGSEFAFLPQKGLEVRAGLTLP